MTNTPAPWQKQALYFLGMLALHILVVCLPPILLLVIFYFLGPVLGGNLHPIATSLKLILLAAAIFSFVLFILILISPIYLTFYVFNDAKKLKAHGVDMWSPEIWGAIMFICWIPGLAFYLTMKRFHYSQPHPKAS